MRCDVHSNYHFVHQFLMVAIQKYANGMLINQKYLKCAFLRFEREKCLLIHVHINYNQNEEACAFGLEINVACSTLMVTRVIHGVKRIEDLVRTKEFHSRSKKKTKILMVPWNKSRCVKFG